MQASANRCGNPDHEDQVTKFWTVRLIKFGGKGLFVKELDRALLEGRSQLSVHSLKDMPMEVSEELPILAFFQTRKMQGMYWFLPEGCYTLDPIQTHRMFQSSKKTAAERNLPGYACEKHQGKSSDQTGKAG